MSHTDKPDEAVQRQVPSFQKRMNLGTLRHIYDWKLPMAIELPHLP
jgi:hypothetical protein